MNKTKSDGRGSDPLGQRSILFSNLLLLGFEPGAMEAKYSIPFTKDMFAMPNKKAFEVVMYFLLTRLNPALAKERFRVCYPVCDKKQEQLFRRAVSNWLTEITNDDHEAYLPRIAPSLLMSPSGDKFYNLLLHLSAHVLNIVARSSHGLKSRDLLQRPRLVPSSIHLGGVMMKTVGASAVRHRKRFLQQLQETTDMQQQWAQYATELTKEHRTLTKSIRGLEQKLQDQYDRANHLAKARGSPPPVRRRQSGDYFEGEPEIQAIRRTKKVQKVRELWKAINELYTAQKAERDVLQSILEGAANRFKLDASDINVHIPELLLRDCEKELQRRNLANTYEGGKLNLLTLIQLWNLSLHLYLEQLNQESLPDFGELSPTVVTQVHNQHTHLTNTQALRSTLANELLPQLKESIALLKEELEVQGDSTLKQPGSLRSSRNKADYLTLLPSTPPVSFLPDTNIRGGTPKEITGRLLQKSPDIMDTPEAATLLRSVIDKAAMKHTALAQGTPVSTSKHLRDMGSKLPRPTTKVGGDVIEDRKRVKSAPSGIHSTSTPAPCEPLRHPKTTKKISNGSCAHRSLQNQAVKEEASKDRESILNKRRNELIKTDTKRKLKPKRDHNHHKPMSAVKASITAKGRGTPAVGDIGKPPFIDIVRPPAVTDIGRPPVSVIGTPPVGDISRPPVSDIGRPLVSHIGRPPVSHIGTPAVNHIGRLPVSDIGTPAVSDIGRSTVSEIGRTPVSDISRPHVSDVSRPAVSCVGKPMSAVKVTTAAHLRLADQIADAVAGSSADGNMSSPTIQPLALDDPLAALHHTPTIQPLALDDPLAALHQTAFTTRDKLNRTPESISTNTKHKGEEMALKSRSSPMPTKKLFDEDWLDSPYGYQDLGASEFVEEQTVLKDTYEKKDVPTEMLIDLKSSSSGSLSVNSHQEPDIKFLDENAEAEGMHEDDSNSDYSTDHAFHTKLDLDLQASDSPLLGTPQGLYKDFQSDLSEIFASRTPSLPLRSRQRLEARKDNFVHSPIVESMHTSVALKTSSLDGIEMPVDGLRPPNGDILAGFTPNNLLKETRLSVESGDSEQSGESVPKSSLKSRNQSEDSQKSVHFSSDYQENIFQEEENSSDSSENRDLLGNDETYSKHDDLCGDSSPFSSSIQSGKRHNLSGIFSEDESLDLDTSRPVEELLYYISPAITPVHLQRPGGAQLSNHQTDSPFDITRHDTTVSLLEKLKLSSVSSDIKSPQDSQMWKSILFDKNQQECSNPINLLDSQGDELSNLIDIQNEDDYEWNKSTMPRSTSDFDLLDEGDDSILMPSSPTQGHDHSPINQMTSPMAGTDHSSIIQMTSPMVGQLIDI